MKKTVNTVQNVFIASFATLLVVFGTMIPQHLMEDAAKEKRAKSVKAAKDRADLLTSNQAGVITKLSAQNTNLADELTLVYQENGKVRASSRQLMKQVKENWQVIASLQSQNKKVIQHDHVLVAQLMASQSHSRRVLNSLSVATAKIAGIEAQLTSEKFDHKTNIAQAHTATVAIIRQLAEMKNTVVAQTAEIASLKRSVSVASANTVNNSTVTNNNWGTSQNTSTTSIPKPFFVPVNTSNDGKTGHARFSISLGADSTVVDVTLLESSGDTVLDDRLKESLLKSKWRSNETTPAPAAVRLSIDQDMKIASL